MIWFEVDLSQIESRIVYMLTGDPELVRLAQAAPWEFDQHTYNASIIYNVPEQSIKDALKLEKSDPRAKRAKEQRYTAKKTVHGAQRDMQGKRLADTMLLDGVHVTVPQCDGYLETYHARFPAIRDVYFKNIRRMLMRDRLIVSTWGRRFDARYDRLEPELFRQGYSFLPQAENADHLNQHGLLPLYWYLKALERRPPGLQVHDSLAGSCEPANAYDVLVYTKQHLEVPILLAGNVLRPYVEFKLGTTWEAEYEWKRLPSREEVTQIAYELDKKAKARV